MFVDFIHQSEAEERQCGLSSLRQTEAECKASQMSRDGLEHAVAPARCDVDITSHDCLNRKSQELGPRSIADLG